jgi:CO/xanthine dehydrogenase FAD-binding subunit
VECHLGGDLGQTLHQEVRQSIPRTQIRVDALELSGISRTESGHLVIGALRRYRTIERDRACQDDLW